VEKGASGHFLNKLKSQAVWTHDMKPIGKIVQLARYPVKSMRGEALAATKLTLQGVPEDRRYAFVQTASRSDFPWLTARQTPRLLRYKPAVDTERSGEVVVNVTTPNGAKWPVDSRELHQEIEQLSGRSLFLLRNNRGCFDTAQISIISRQTVRRIAAESGTDENPWRFRPNFLIDLSKGEAYEEVNWTGKILRLGDSARVAITKVDERCVIITLDPESTEASPDILHCVAQQHANIAGVYGAVLTAGEIRTGDPIWLET
jgi:uncharacterized protein